jgi:hypothetical protein
MHCDIARLESSIACFHKNLADLGMAQRVLRGIRQQILFRDIGDIFRLGIFREEMIKRLIAAGAHFFGNGIPPFLGVVENGVISNTTPRNG